MLPSEPLLLQRATLQHLRCDLLLNSDRSQLQNFLEIAHEDLFKNPQDTLDKVSIFLNLSALSYDFPKNIEFPSSNQAQLIAEQQAVISTVHQSFIKHNF